jgi:transcriptional regulator with XRE-family HTH domain
MADGRIPELTLGDRLMLSREKARIGSHEMAAKFHKTRSTITNWEKGRSEPSHTEIKEWARITGYSLDWIMDGQLSVEPNEDEVRERLATMLVKQMMGDPSRTRFTPPGVTFAELDLRPDADDYVLDVREEPATVIEIHQMASSF